MRFQSPRFYDEPLFETANFVAVPSLGGFVEGWTLIVPKSPLINLSRLNPSLSSEFQSFVKSVSDVVSATYGSVTIFEHGAAFAGSLIGCGTDQAHLHIVPFQFEMLPAPNGHFDAWLEVSGRLPSELGAQDEDYLWIAVNNQSYIARPNAPVSQYFRKAIATVIGKPEEWNYKEFPQVDRVEATLKRLRAADYA